MVWVLSAMGTGQLESGIQAAEEVTPHSCDQLGPKTRGSNEPCG